MELFLSSVNVVLPLFLMMAAGWFLKKTRLVTEAGINELNRANVRFFLPVMQFANICEGNLLKESDPSFLLFSVSASVLIFLLCMFVAPLFIKDKSRRIAYVLGVYRPNLAIYGLPLAQSILGNAEQVSNVLMMISVMILITNFLAVMAIEIFKGEKIKPLILVIRSVNNPVIYGISLGVAAQFLPFSLPQVLMSPIKSIAAVATPFAFVVLGASFTLRESGKNIKTISSATFLKLVATPLLTIPAGVLLFGFRGASLVALLCAFATPTAVNVLPLVLEAKGDDKLMGEIIVFTTGASILTIFGFVFVFKLLGFF